MFAQTQVRDNEFDHYIKPVLYTSSHLSDEVTETRYPSKHTGSHVACKMQKN